ncbi:short-chain dehydrogenase [Pseudomassariella vexata]|uniref:Short-chain dehydrogenase n=1 Tax=Pseudomassariella vexata TaxID=1141098 RepID=A0A1Y2DKY1_9PEZI|nr:short-chain dehydrogenase [Pseudomassariella vexata]ORY59948.1 short-chain dehydrogenase [Pseudomassariella vexata]
MSTPKERVEALGKQLQSGATFEGMPVVKTVAGSANELRLDSKVVIITGANSILGIGRASAHQFAANGAKAIYICDYDESNLGKHKREINSIYPNVHIHVRRFDAAEEKAVQEVVEDAISKYGRLDVFFANAGIVGPHAHFKDVSKDDFMKVMETNVASVFLAAKHAAPAMMKTSSDKKVSSGSIIGTASVAGIRSNAGSTPYSAAKAGVVSLAQTCAYQLAGTNVRVNAICPGIIETGMTAPTFEAARARGTEKKIGQLNPLKRYGVADEIARVALFLASDEASYVNGQAWAVDGGLSAGHPYVIGKLA